MSITTRVYYILYISKGEFNFLQHGWFSVCTLLVLNVVGKPASMSSEWDSIRTADRANDGICEEHSEELFSIAHTQKEQDPWWRVDLEKVFQVYAVAVLNRGWYLTGTCILQHVFCIECYFKTHSVVVQLLRTITLPNVFNKQLCDPTL